MKKYLIVVRGYNEPDNNTPSDEVLVKIAEHEPKELGSVVASLRREFENDYPHGVDIDFYDIEKLGKWKGVATIW